MDVEKLARSCYKTLMCSRGRAHIRCIAQKNSQISRDGLAVPPDAFQDSMFGSMRRQDLNRALKCSTCGTTRHAATSTGLCGTSSLSTLRPQSLATATHVDECMSTTI